MKSQLLQFPLLVGWCGLIGPVRKFGYFNGKLICPQTSLIFATGRVRHGIIDSSPLLYYGSFWGECYLLLVRDIELGIGHMILLGSLLTLNSII